MHDRLNYAFLQFAVSTRSAFLPAPNRCRLSVLPNAKLQEGCTVQHIKSFLQVTGSPLIHETVSTHPLRCDLSVVLVFHSLRPPFTPLFQYMFTAMCYGGGAGFLLGYEDFGRMFDNSFPACVFLVCFFKWRFLSGD